MKVVPETSTTAQTVPTVPAVPLINGYMKCSVVDVFSFFQSWRRHVQTDIIPCQISGHQRVRPCEAHSGCTTCTTCSSTPASATRTLAQHFSKTFDFNGSSDRTIPPYNNSCLGVQGWRRRRTSARSGKCSLAEICFRTVRCRCIRIISFSTEFHGKASCTWKPSEWHRP